MKKFLSLFLVLTMVLSMLTLPTFAEGEPDPGVGTPTTAPVYSFTPVPIDKGTTEVDYKGKTYKVVWTYEDFLGMTATDGEAYYILGDDIDFTGFDSTKHTFGTFTSDVKSYNTAEAGAIRGVVNAKFHLEGNGKKIENLVWNLPKGSNNLNVGSGLFATGNTGDHTISNLTVEPTSIALIANATGLFYGITGATSKLAFENVNVKVANFTHSKQAQIAIYLAKPNGPATFTNCVLSGELEFVNDNNGGMGGFVGKTNNNAANLTFTDCDVTANYSANSGATAAYVGWPANTVTINFTRCDASGSFTTKTGQNDGKGVYIGITSVATTINFTDCDASGDFTFNDYKSGAYVGNNKAATKLTFQRCNASGKFKFAKAGGTAAYIGFNDYRGIGTINFNGCDVSGTFTMLGEGAGYVGYNEAKPTFNFYKCDASGKFTMNGSNAAAYVGRHKQTGSQAINANYVFNGCKASGTYNGTTTVDAVYIAMFDSAAGTVSFTECSIEGAMNFAGTSGGFVAKVNAAVALTFKDCTVETTMTASGSQTGGYIGLLTSTGTATFTNCAADVTVYTTDNRVSPFIGQMFGSGRVAVDGLDNPQTVYMKDCTVSGTFVSNNKWNGGFIGVVGGSWQNPDTKKWSIGDSVVTFDNCETDIDMFCSYSTSAFVASNGGGVMDVTFKNCTNNATIYSVSSAGAWVAETSAIADSAVAAEKEVKVYVDEATCTNTAKIYSKALYTGDNTTAYTAITAEQIASGEFAYKMAQAQETANVDAKYIFGQTINTDAEPKLGGAAVEIVTTAKGESVYANGKYTVEGEVEPKSYIQLTPVASNKRNARVIIAVSDEKLAEINTVTITFTLADETTKTFTVEKNDIDSYYAVWAGGEIAEAAEGYVLLAVAIKNIPVGAEGANWNVTGNEVQDVVVTVA